jgi:predicted ester cyclase
MSVEENKAIFRRFIEEVWNKGNLAVADELFALNAVSPSAPQLPPGPEGVKIITTMFRSAFPDFHMRIEDLIAEGDKVVARFTESGTHTGEFMGIAPTGKRVEFTEIGILRIVAGKVIESWYETDMLGLMQRLGTIPPIGQNEA